MAENNSEIEIEAAFVKQRRQENRRVSDIADEGGLLGEEASTSNALKFATQTRQTDPEMLARVFDKAGLLEKDDDNQEENPKS